MFRATGNRAMVVVATMLTVSLHALAQTPAIARKPSPTERQLAGQTFQAIASNTTTGRVIGSAWRGESQPYPQARIRLRSVDNGRSAGRTVGDAEGRFRFERVEPGAYVVELMSSDDRVLAVGDLFGVTAGGQATTLVRLSSKAPWFAGFFANAAAAAITAASAVGVTAVGSNGSPASGQ